MSPAVLPELKQLLGPRWTTRTGFATPDEPPLERARFLMLRCVSAAELGHRLAHSWRR